MHSINLVHDLPPFDEQHNLRVVVETPRGANIKIKFDEDLGCFCLSRILPLGVTYPYDFGFVPQTLAQDGDPLDVLALVEAVTYPGVVIACRLLGALQVEERGLRGRPNHRLVAVPVKAARKDDLRNFIDLGRRAQQELERFFVMSSAFTSKDPVVRGWVGPEAASDMVHRAIARYREKHGLPPLPPRPHRHPRFGGPPGSGPSGGATAGGQAPSATSTSASAPSASSSTASSPSATSSDGPAGEPESSGAENT